METEEENTYANVLAAEPDEDSKVDENAFDTFAGLLQNLACIINTKYNGNREFSLAMEPPVEDDDIYVFTIVEFLETQKDPKHLKRMDPNDFSNFLIDFEKVFHQYSYNAGMENIDTVIPDIFIDYKENEEMLVTVQVPHLLCLHGMLADLASEHGLKLPNDMSELSAECEEILGQWIMEKAPRSLELMKLPEIEGP